MHQKLKSSFVRCVVFRFTVSYKIRSFDQQPVHVGLLKITKAARTFMPVVAYIDTCISISTSSLISNDECLVSSARTRSISGMRTGISIDPHVNSCLPYTTTFFPSLVEHQQRTSTPYTHFNLASVRFPTTRSFHSQLPGRVLPAGTYYHPYPSFHFFSSSDPNNGRRLFCCHTHPPSSLIEVPPPPSSLLLLLLLPLHFISFCLLLLLLKNQDHHHQHHAIPVGRCRCRRRSRCSGSGVLLFLGS